MFAGGTRYPERAELAPDVRTLVVLGDPHGDVAGVRLVMEREAGEGVRWLCVGDVVGRRDGPACSELCALLEAEDVLTVEGNHEHWVNPEGRMAVLGNQDDDPMLTPEARAWVRSRPWAVEIFHLGLGRRVAAMTHSLRDPTWRDVDAGNAARLCQGFGGPDLLLVGHSHKPKLIRVGKRGRPEMEAFDFVEHEKLDGAVPPDGTLVVDAGSVGGPRSGDFGPTLPGLGERYGTYAVVDLEAGRVSLRRILKG